ncbi:vesicle transport protein USE1 isoform X1 [Homalodisca vitripennis]|uniref:vesicle transport protein USE1 isoform X1 n=2 Tax=Homalodisca vitripennis TaxID=197043 RepID=UPI001EEBDFAC|nr:vesicle transport protein USE1 isoform X1 [Homalodisca vitripennis]
MGRSRLETNFRRLLARCEIMAKEYSSDDWRLEKFISTLEEMLIELEKTHTSPGKETLSSYMRRIDFLKGLMDTTKMTNPVEKVVASQLLSPLPDSISKETHQKTVTKYTKELRDELLGEKDGLRQRQSMSSSEDMDALLKYHHNMHEKIAENMLSLAKNMKEKSQLAGEIIKRDIETVDKSSNLAEKNFSQLKVESERLQEHSRRAWKCWMWVMLVVVIVIFINMVLFMKVMKKRKY